MKYKKTKLIILLISVFYTCTPKINPDFYTKPIEVSVYKKKNKKGKLDKILKIIGKLSSKEAIIAYILILAPSLYTYLKYINPDLISNLIEKAARQTTKIAIQSGGKVTHGIIKELLSNKLDALKLLAGVYLVQGIPFLFKLGLKSLL